MKSRRVCITLRWSLDDDVNYFLGQLRVNDIEELGGLYGEFLLLSHRVQINTHALIRDRNEPDGESVCSDDIEFGRFLKLELDGFLEFADSLGRLDFDRKRGMFTINETVQV